MRAELRRRSVELGTDRPHRAGRRPPSRRGRSVLRRAGRQLGRASRRAPRPAAALCALLPLIPRGLRVADIGTGTGRHAAAARRDSPSNIVAVDMSEEMLRRARDSRQDTRSLQRRIRQGRPARLPHRDRERRRRVRHARPASRAQARRRHHGDGAHSSPWPDARRRRPLRPSSRMATRRARRRVARLHARRDDRPSGKAGLARPNFKIVSRVESRAKRAVKARSSFSWRAGGSRPRIVGPPRLTRTAHRTKETTH